MQQNIFVCWCVCVHVFVCVCVPCIPLVVFNPFLKVILLFAWIIGDWREFHALYKFVPEFVLDLGTVKRPLVTCIVGYVWVSELYVIWLCRQSEIFITVIFLIKTRRDTVNLSVNHPQPGKTGMHVVDVSSVCPVKGKMCSSVLRQLQLCQVFLCCTWTYYWTVINMGYDQCLNNYNNVFLYQKQRTYFYNRHTLPQPHLNLINMTCPWWLTIQCYT